MLSRVNFSAPKGRTVAGAPNPTLAAVLAGQGRGGDSLVAHINPQEAQILHALGGKGDVNPKTGLLEFDPSGSSGGPNGGSAGGDGNNGNNGGGGGGYNGQGRGASMAPGGGLVGGDLANDGSTRPGESAFHAANADYNGSILGHVFGATPTLTNSASYADGTWHTGFNPGSVIGGIAGTAMGLPGLGLLTGGAYKALGGSDVVVGGPGAPATEGMARNAGVVGANGANMSNGPAGSFNGGNSGLNGGGQDPRQQMGPGAAQGAPALAAAMVPNTAGGGLNPASNPTVGMPMAPWMHGMRRRPPLVSMHGVGGH